MSKSRDPSLVVVLLLVAVAPLLACAVVHIGHAPNLRQIDLSQSSVLAVEPSASEPARSGAGRHRIEARPAAASEVQP